MDLREANLEFHIEELVLHGFEGSDRSLISAAVQQELSRLFTERGVPRSLSQGGTIPQINGGSFEMAPGTRPGVIGTQIAQSIYGGLGE